MNVFDKFSLVHVEGTRGVRTGDFMMNIIQAMISHYKKKGIEFDTIFVHPEFVYWLRNQQANHNGMNKLCGLDVKKSYDLEETEYKFGIS